MTDLPCGQSPALLRRRQNVFSGFDFIFYFSAVITSSTTTSNMTDLPCGQSPALLFSGFDFIFYFSAAITSSTITSKRKRLSAGESVQNIK